MKLATNGNFTQTLRNGIYFEKRQYLSLSTAKSAHIDILNFGKRGNTPDQGSPTCGPQSYFWRPSSKSLSWTLINYILQIYLSLEINNLFCNFHQKQILKDTKLVLFASWFLNIHNIATNDVYTHKHTHGHSQCHIYKHIIIVIHFLF